jgi:hypothetical protein
MPDGNTILNSAAAWFSGGAGIGAGYMLFRYIFEWVGVRVDKREAALEASTARHDAANQALIDNLLKRLEVMNERITGLERELDECRKRDAEKDARLAKLEAQQLGLGEARNHAQTIIAADRQSAIRRAAK